MSQVLSPVDQFQNSWWQTLSGEHSQFSIGNDIARRYLSTISPFAAIRDISEEAFEALATIAEPDDVLVLMHDKPLQLPDHWNLIMRDELVTMVLEKKITEMPPDFEYEIQSLSTHDVADMLALTELTHPGPFRPDTILLGNYFGIRIGGTLVAMAGERGQLPEYTEVSAVCTHPEYQRQGLAKAIVTYLCLSILSKGKTPMLRLLSTNDRAYRVYKDLGFEQVGSITHAVRFHAIKSKD